MKSLLKRIKRFYLSWKYRRYDDNICCCGSDIREASLLRCVSSCKSMKDYLIENELNKGETK
jgi:hypothetical protein